MGTEQMDALLLAARYDNAALERSSREIVAQVTRTSRPAAQASESVRFKGIGRDLALASADFKRGRE